MAIAGIVSDIWLYSTLGKSEAPRSALIVLSAVGAAFGPKPTCATALHMSAFGGKADMNFAGIRFCGRYWE